jgi:Ca2+-binding EF-hand superfamily protein
LQRWLPRAASDAIHEAVANAVSQDHLSAFDALDSNGNGYLDAGELLPLMQVGFPSAFLELFLSFS